MNPPRTPLPPARALVAVLVILLAQFAGVLHLAIERHEVCADHGELVHGASNHVDGVAELAGEHEGPALRDAGGDAEHEHCDVLPFDEPQREALTRAAESWRVPNPLVARAIDPGARRRSSVPLLLRAPKLSPPA